jgi:hypothetical protein
VGSVVHINGDPFTVLGVMPETLSNIDTPDLWQALHLSRADPGYGGDNFQMIARLKPGVSVTQASAELEGITGEIYRKFPDYLRWAGRARLKCKSLYGPATDRRQRCPLEPACAFCGRSGRTADGLPQPGGLDDRAFSGAAPRDRSSFRTRS